MKAPATGSGRRSPSPVVTGMLLILANSPFQWVPVMSLRIIALAFDKYRVNVGTNHDLGCALISTTGTVDSQDDSHCHKFQHEYHGFAMMPILSLYLIH
jgi:hypothetical protein